MDNVDTTNSKSVTVYVTYQGDPDTRFDRAYYVDHHLPLVMRAWQKHGLESATAFFPAKDETGTIAICECRFADEVAMNKAFGSSDTPTVMADVVHFTDVEPKRVRATAI